MGEIDCKSEGACWKAGCKHHIFQNSDWIQTSRPDIVDSAERDDYYAEWIANAPFTCMRDAPEGREGNSIATSAMAFLMGCSPQAVDSAYKKAIKKMKRGLVRIDIDFEDLLIPDIDPLWKNNPRRIK